LPPGWITDYPYRGGAVRAYYAGGNGGQYVIVVPKLDLVAAFYGGNYADRPARFRSRNGCRSLCYLR
jgi:CubicO group peptidase (beta-lactamase class C family)